MAHQKIAKTGVKRQDGYLYYIDKHGDVSRSPKAVGGKKQGRAEKVVRIGLKKEKGYLYYLDKQGDVARAAMVRR
jgi:uncharacterized protein YcgL (UPF0745 family)